VKNGELLFYNFVAPHLYHYITVQNDKSGKRTEKRYGTGESTYFYQLQHFVECVKNGVHPSTDSEDAIKNMRVIDAIYEKAGMKVRG